jgi:DNA-binding LacI/PurR family transcriptional regulator
MQSAGRQATLDAVAALAGVSRATASRVINGSPRVSPTSRKAVEDAVAALDFVPNRSARNLARQRTDSVALVISEPEDRLFADPFFAAIVRGITAELALTELQLVLAMSQSKGDHHRLERYLDRADADGVLFVSLHAGDPLPERFAARGTPTVLCGRLDSAPGVPYVDVDNRGGAAQAVRYLVEQGRTRIATIAGPQDMCAGTDRLAGYTDVVTRGPLVAHGDFSQDSGEAAMYELLEAAPDLDAVFAASDPMALGALRALRASGRRVPDDVAVVGFDGIDAVRHADPPLTTVRQPVEDMGREMTRMLLSAMEGRALGSGAVDGGAGQRRGPAEPVILPVELVVRESA